MRVQKNQFFFGLELTRAGYGLPVDEQEEKEAENDCRAMMERIYEIYKEADKGIASNVVLTDETILELQKKLMETSNSFDKSFNVSVFGTVSPARVNPRPKKN